MKKTSAPAFWDSSALVLLVCQQSLSAKARAAHRIHSLLHVWWGTRIECHSALQCLIREGALTSKEERQAMSSLGKLANQWVEILPAEDIRQQAERLLSVHPLRAADALQLSELAKVFGKKLRQGNAGKGMEALSRRCDSLAAILLLTVFLQKTFGNSLSGSADVVQRFSQRQTIHLR